MRPLYRHPRSIVWIVASLVMGWWLAYGGTCAVAADEDLSHLEERIEALEAQNRELLRRLDQNATTATPHATNDETEEVQTSFEKPEAPSQPSGAGDGWYEVGSDLKLSAVWKNGLELQTAHKDFRVHVGGRTQVDLSWFSPDPQLQADPAIVNPIRDGVDFRRARLRIDGTMYEQIEWAAEYDFMNSTNTLSSPAGTATPTGLGAPTDLWWAFTSLPYVGNLKVGNHKEPIGFEHLVSSRFLPFMERSFNQDAFYGAFNNGFTPGISAYDTLFDETSVWAIGIFKPTTNVFAFSNTPADYAITGRITRLLYYEDDGRELGHIGFSARHAALAAGTVRYRTRGPERSGISSTWPLLADTKTLEGESNQMLNFEAVANHGSWTIQSEYLLNYVQDASKVAGPTVGTLFYYGGYVEILYFLTGEHREYSRKTGTFERVTPIENAFLISDDCGMCHGWGAWQAGFRYNILDLDDQGINGGRLHDFTWGLNWFLNPNMKVQWNYSLTHRNSPTSAANDGSTQGFGVRLAHDF